MADCIYCRRRTEETQFSRAEHVVPKAFGRFKNNFTLFSVCEECNQWFGDNLERSFGRNSGEAILRVMFGIKAPLEAHQVGGTRIETVLDDQNELKGAKIYFTAAADGRLVAKAPLQVGFRVPGRDETQWFLESELTAEAVAPFVGCETRTIGGDEAAYTRVEQTLQDLGLSRQETLWIQEDETSVLVETAVRIDYQLDVEVLRTVAKIGFNYLAYHAGPEFALLPEFDAYRQFVRYGEGDQEEFVRITTSRLLYEERRFGGKQTRGHLLAAEWHPRHDAPTGSVLLFNDLHYKLSFADRMRVLWREIRFGHHFDIEDMTIDKMSVVWWRPVA